MQDFLRRRNFSLGTASVPAVSHAAMSPVPPNKNPGELICIAWKKNVSNIEARPTFRCQDKGQLEKKMLAIGFRSTRWAPLVTDIGRATTTLPPPWSGNDGLVWRIDALYVIPRALGLPNEKDVKRIIA